LRSLPLARLLIIPAKYQRGGGKPAVGRRGGGGGGGARRLRDEGNRKKKVESCVFPAIRSRLAAFQSYVKESFFESWEKSRTWRRVRVGEGKGSTLRRLGELIHGDTEREGELSHRLAALYRLAQQGCKNMGKK